MVFTGSAAATPYHLRLRRSNCTHTTVVLACGASETRYEVLAKFSGKHQSSTQTTKAKQRKKCSSLMIISAGPVYLNRMESSWKPRGREVCVGQKMYKFVETIGG